jgi:hypothetical protein
MDFRSDKGFQIGLAMSGAVSAGAYTAGVFDFLIQALDEWEKASAGGYRDEGIDPDKIPNHWVGLKVMSGASAGAITAAIGAVALADATEEPRPFDRPPAGTQPIKCYLPKLYETWVVKPGLVAEPRQPSDSPRPAGEATLDFLQTGDLDPPKSDAVDFSRTHSVPKPPEGTPVPVTSLLNSRLLDQIANAGIEVAEIREGDKPGGKPRTYVSKSLHIYLTLSNLRGVPYRIPFAGGDYHMISHGDRVHYQIEGAGNWDSEQTKSDFADHDKPRPIKVEWLKTGAAEKSHWKDYSICALASAAFPVGLAARDIGAVLGTNVALNEYADRRFPIEGVNDGDRISPNWPEDVLESAPFWFRTADGGIIDNDPFEYARFTLMEKLDEPNPSKLEVADRAVIMISPFPEAKPIRQEGQPAPDVMSVYSALMPSLIDQARFKPSELVRAADPNYGSRYLIGPSRVTPDGKEQVYAIASGLLGGFGGFVARSFRDHDFQLGRRNCQRFLQEAFALPSVNAIVKNWPRETAAVATFKSHRLSASGDNFRAIIPLFGTARAEVVLQEWPQVTGAQLQNLDERIAQRFDYLAPVFLSQNVRGFLGFLLWLATERRVSRIPGFGLIRTRVLSYANLAILTDLVRRNQIKDWDDLGSLPADTGLAPELVRAILAELIDPGFDQRTAEGIVKGVAAHMPDGSEGATQLTAAKVEDILRRCKSAEGKPYQVWEAPWKDKAGNVLYTLASRAKDISWFDRLATPFGSFIARLPFGPAERIGNWFPKPRTDPPGVA